MWYEIDIHHIDYQYIKLDIDKIGFEPTRIVNLLRNYNKLSLNS